MKSRNLGRTAGTLLAAVCVWAMSAAAQQAPDVRASTQPAPDGSGAARSIPDGRIAALEAELAKREEGASLVSRRMACKSIVREAEALLKEFPAAPNRYRVLGVVFQGQKRLLGLENSERNRAALLDTCEKMAQAPDEYADLRLEADLLLSDRDLTAKGATLAERAKALAAIVDRYRGTPAEAKSLMMAALIAPKLQAEELEQTIHQAMDSRRSTGPSSSPAATSGTSGLLR